MKMSNKKINWEEYCRLIQEKWELKFLIKAMETINKLRKNLTGENK